MKSTCLHLSPSRPSLNVLFLLSLFWCITVSHFWVLLVADTVGISPWHSPLGTLLPKAVYCKYLQSSAQGLFSSKWHSQPKCRTKWKSWRSRPLEAVVGPCTLVGIPLRLSSAVPWGSQPDRTPGAHSGNWLEQHLQLAPFSSGLTFQLHNHCFLGLPASNHLHWNCCLRVCFWGTPHKTLLIFKIFSMTVDIQCYSALVAGVQHSDGDNHILCKCSAK